MSQKNAIDRILSEIGPQIQAKVSELLGHPLQLGRLETGTFLAGELQNPPTRVLCYLEVEGFATGTAYLGIGLSDAVRLGGTLVMLPGEELETRAGGEDFDGEEADAYGEIASSSPGLSTRFSPASPRERTTSRRPGSRLWEGAVEGHPPGRPEAICSTGLPGP